MKNRNSKLYNLLKIQNSKFEITKQLILSLAIIIALVGATSYTLFINKEQKAQAYDNWYDADWSYRKQITIDHTKVSATLTDFPVLINLASDTDLATYAQDDGDDILFTLSNETTKLSHEIEKFDGNTGELVTWVKIPSLSSTTDTTLYMYYGNSSCSSQQNATDVWSNGYVGVWHMNQDPGPGGAGDILDSTSNNNDGTAEASMTSDDLVDGQLGKAIDFDGSNDYIDVGSNAILDITDKITLEAWAKPGDVTAYRTIIANRPSSHRANYVFRFHSGNIEFYFGNGTNWYIVSTVGSGIVANNWYHITVNYIYGTSNIEIYINGIPQTIGSWIGNPVGVAPTTDGSVTIGKQVESGENLIGIIDEPRVSSTVRSADWIATEYANQNDPSTFYSLDIPQERELIAPTNPTTFKTYSSSAKTLEFTNGGWGNATAPYFEWSGATDEGGSGIDGYYLYLGTDNTADPAVTSGIINADNSPYYTTLSHFTLSRSMTENETYYFRIKTRDKAANLSSAETKFTYSFDSQAPNPPEYINVSPVGCSTSTSFDFSWPAAADNGDSGLAGYQYKAGVAGTIQTTTDLAATVSSYQDGENIFLLRSIDNAGNTSVWRTRMYCTIQAPKIIDGPTVEARPSSLVISWISSKDTTSRVEIYEGNEYLSEFGQSNFTSEHTVNAIGLKSSQTYRYRLSWLDKQGNYGNSSWYETSTQQAPQIQKLRFNPLSGTSVLTSFSTNYSAQVSINYGKESTSDNSVSFDGYSTYFSHQLTGLEAGTTYKVDILATTEDGTEFSAGDSFTTPPLPSISSLSFETSVENAAPQVKVSWSTNVDTTSSVFYRVQGQGSYKEISSSDKTKTHEVIIDNLADSTIYELYATGIDQYGNTARSDTNSFTTPFDTRPPKISDIVIESSNVGVGREDEAQIAVSWKTDEPSTSYVEYGQGISSDQYTAKTNPDPTQTNSHLVIVSGLKDAAPHHLRVCSTDKGNNTSCSKDNTVIPGKAPKSILNIILRALENAFGWMKNII